MDRSYYKEYYYLERNHWWFKARLNIIEFFLLKRVLPLASGKSILNVGPATGATTTLLEKYGDVQSLEYDQSCCDFLHSINIPALQGSFAKLPFGDASFDLVCAFDVIEHIADDLTAVEEAFRVLRAGGTFFLTVPAFNFLWSRHDEVNHHYRRYTLDILKKLFGRTNFNITDYTYFNTLLFPPIAIFRLLSRWLPRKTSHNASGSDFEVLGGQTIFSRLLFQVFNAELLAFQRGMRFPFGTSIMLIAKKN